MRKMREMGACVVVWEREKRTCACVVCVWLAFGWRAAVWVRAWRAAAWCVWGLGVRMRGFDKIDISDLITCICGARK